MAVSSIGVGSGLPLDQLLQDLRDNENNALTLIQSKQVTAQNRLSAYGKIQSSVEALKTAGENLANADAFGALQATVGGDAFTASATPKAIAGQYSIVVHDLASAQTLVTQGVASRDEANGQGGVITLTLDDGSQKTLDLAGKDTSLKGLAEAINSSDPGLGVHATLVNDGSGTPYRLLLTADATGTQASVSAIEVSGNAPLQDLLGFGAGAPGSTVQEQAAADARISVNGIEIVSQSNQIEDAIEGVTLNLQKTSTDAASLSLTRDDSAATKAINAFVTAYNNLQSTIQSLTSYDVDAQQSSALTGDTLARRVQSQARDVLNVSLGSGSVRSLAQLGISTDPSTGALSVDNDKLAAAIKDHLGDVQQLFAGEQGISSRMGEMAKGFLGSDGLISNAKAGADRNIDDLQKQYEKTAERIDAKMETYRQQFTALDSMVAQMNSVSSYLTQQLSMLGNLNSDQ